MIATPSAGRSCPRAQPIRTLRPVAVVGESVPLAQRHDRFRAREHALGIAAHLVQQRGVGERERLAVQVIQPPRERDRLLRVGHRGVLFAEQPQRVRVPGVREHAEVGPERGALRMRSSYAASAASKCASTPSSSPTLNSVPPIA